MAELNAALCLDTKARNLNINLSKYFISLSGDRTLNQSVLQTYFVQLRHDWPPKLILPFPLFETLSKVSKNVIDFYCTYRYVFIALKKITSSDYKIHVFEVLAQTETEFEKVL